MRPAASAALIASLLATPATATSLFDFGTGQADAHVPVGDTFFNIWMSHKGRDEFLIEPSVKTAFFGGGHYPDPTWRMVAEAFVNPVGCGISEVRPISRIGAAWVAEYVCPAGVDLRALVHEQRAALQHGERLTGGIPPAAEPPPAPPVAEAAPPATPLATAPAAAPVPEPKRPRGPCLRVPTDPGQDQCR
ncbi:MAG TPA: hypothetical protein VG939_05375 [Caulobacteraceae bacterium]|nr:hypothetical protein [Caulobacteraceae bacterium]